MPADDARSVVVRFNQCINSRNHDALASLMTDDHVFIDSDNRAIQGKSAVVGAWRRFFDLFPDYRNVFERIVVDDEAVVIAGHSICSDRRLQGPALWTASVREGKVAEWRVYEDTDDTRMRLGIG